MVRESSAQTDSFLNSFFKMNKNENKIDHSQEIHLEELENLIENDDTGKLIEVDLYHAKMSIINGFSDEDSVLIPAWIFKLPRTIEPERTSV